VSQDAAQAEQSSNSLLFLLVTQHIQEVKSVMSRSVDLHGHVRPESLRARVTVCRFEVVFVLVGLTTQQETEESIRAGCIEGGRSGGRGGLVAVHEIIPCALI
jgi:hypothetical protein